MTRFEALAKAYPLHIQRIAEETYKSDPVSYEYTMAIEESRMDIRKLLSLMFIWRETPEGWDYWNALDKGGFVQ